MVHTSNKTKELRKTIALLASSLRKAAFLKVSAAGRPTAKYNTNQQQQYTTTRLYCCLI
jgi:hypothetical protein